MRKIIDPVRRREFLLGLLPKGNLCSFYKGWPPLVGSENTTGEVETGREQPEVRTEPGVRYGGTQEDTGVGGQGEEVEGEVWKQSETSDDGVQVQSCGWTFESVTRP